MSIGNLMKADLYRIRKSKMTLLVLISAVIFPLLLIGLYSFLELLLKTADELASEMPEEFGDIFGSLDQMFNLRTMLASAFAMSDNFCLIFPIFSGLLVCGDLTHGTLRSKIVSGHSRTSVYLSHLLSTSVFAAVAALVYIAFMLLFGFLFFDFGAPVNGEVIGQLCRWAVIGIFTFIFCSTVSTCLALCSGNTAFTILLSVAVCLALGLADSICRALESKEVFRDILYLIPSYGNLSAMDMSVPHFWMSLASFGVFCVLNSVIGILIFRKKDLK